MMWVHVCIHSGTIPVTLGEQVVISHSDIRHFLILLGHCKSLLRKRVNIGRSKTSLSMAIEFLLLLRKLSPCLLKVGHVISMQ